MMPASGFRFLRPAVFLDRDGTLMEEVHYCRDPRDVRVVPGAAAHLRRFREAGWLAVVISNQSGIGRGLLTEADYRAVQSELMRQLDGEVDASYFCPDAPEAATPRRKPGIGMVEEAERDLGIDLARSWFVGDKDIDVQCGHNAGMRAVLVRTGHGVEHAGCGAEFEAADVAEALGWILKRELIVES